MNTRKPVAVEKTCKVCDKKFKVFLSQKNQMTCSVNCRSLLMQNIMYEKNDRKQTEKWEPGEILPPKETFVKSKRYGFYVAQNIIGYEFLGQDRSPVRLGPASKYDID